MDVGVIYFNTEAMKRYKIDREHSTLTLEEVYEEDPGVLKVHSTYFRKKPFLRIFVGKDISTDKANFLVAEIERNKYLAIDGLRNKTFSLKNGDVIHTISSKACSADIPNCTMIGIEYTYFFVGYGPILKIKNDDYKEYVKDDNDPTRDFHQEMFDLNTDCFDSTDSEISRIPERAHKYIGKVKKL